MSGTADGGPAEPEAGMGEPASADTGGYFRAVEAAFVRLRGAPLLLSPADYQVAARWHREGVPLRLVEATLEDVFARRKERGARGRINSLRYCAPAVDAAWAEVKELQVPTRRAAGAAAPVEERLGSLAEALPATLADREAWTARVLALRGAPETVEAELRALDAELLVTAEASLDDGARRRLDAEVAAIVEGLRDRFPDAELTTLREQLRRQRLRRALALPALSLF